MARLTRRASAKALRLMAFRREASLPQAELQARPMLAESWSPAVVTTVPTKQVVSCPLAVLWLRRAVAARHVVPLQLEAAVA